MFRSSLTISTVLLCASFPLSAADLLPADQPMESVIDHYVDDLIKTNDVQAASQIDEHIPPIPSVSVTMTRKLWADSSSGDRVVAVVFVALAVLEYINYYHRQLQHFFRRCRRFCSWRRLWRYCAQAAERCTARPGQYYGSGAW